MVSKRIVSLGAGPKPDLELLPFASKVVKKTLVAVDRPTEDAVRHHGYTSWKTKDGQRIFLFHSSNLSFLEKLKENSVDVFSILLPVDMPLCLTPKEVPYFALLDKALRPNGRILFLSENRLLAKSLKAYFSRKGYTIIENDNIKKELMKRSHTISQMKQMLAEGKLKGYFDEKLLFAFILWKKPKK